jgi:glycosyltransferase involved in cell wall biosynthesis
MRASGLLISVVIPHLNQPEYLDLCLASLEAQTLERSAFEIIVVDNGSASPPEGVVARHPGTRLLLESNPGPGLARNRGVAAAAGDILCFIDADCRAHPDWLSSVLRAFNSVPDRTILGGDVQIWRDDKSAFTAIEAYECVFAYRFKLYIERYGFSGTGNLALRRLDFGKVGPFAGIHVAEDAEWGKRAKAAGFTIRYIPEMIVYHPARRSMRELFVKWDRHIQHDLNDARSRHARALGWLFRAFAVLMSPTVDFVKVLSSKRIHGASVRAKAIAVLIAVRAYRAWRMGAVLASTEGVIWNREVDIRLTNADE